MVETIASSSALVNVFGGILELRVSDCIAVLTLCDQSRKNAMSLEMIDALWMAATEIERHDDLRSAIVTGAGDSFSAGGNVQDMVDRQGIFASEDPAHARQFNIRRVHQIPHAIYQIGIPTIAAVNGYAMGGGCDLAMMCDIRICAQSAKFSESFLRVGLVPGDGGAWFLPRVVGLARAMEMALTCNVVDADEAGRIGLVSRIVPDAELMSEAMKLAQTIAGQPASAAKMTKQLMRFGAEASLLDTLQLSAAMQGIAQTSSEHRQAAQRLLTRLRGR